jgi:hypothetical protein
MNENIYLMLGVPYTLLFIVGFMICRGVKKNDAFVQAMREHATDAHSPS